MASPEGHTKEGWLAHLIGFTPPRQVNQNEWAIYVSGEPLPHGWLELSIPLHQETQQTFGRAAWVYKQLLSIRLRGPLAVSPITLLRDG